MIARKLAALALITLSVWLLLFTIISVVVAWQ